ncbi:MAG: threonylcarbamoyl-AMP synthase [Alphaproteobacteria bacterium]|nr:threonylcarbamoyl-AMP synthase [Alphaproteobacteria bacterium]
MNPVEDILETRVLQADRAAVAEAARIIETGGLVAMPTETVYGLAADAANGLAVARIFEAKGRPRFNPLIVHVTGLDAARGLGCFTDEAERLAQAFWPGPMTLVVPRRSGVPISDLVTAGLSTLAIRVPAHPVAKALLAECGRPLAAPSANRSGHVSPTTAAHVAADLSGRVEMILDGGPCQVGIESTVIDVSGDTALLLRPGGISADAVANALGLPRLASADSAAFDPHAPKSPGQLASHYAPKAAIRLNVTAPEPGEAVLAFGPDVPATGGPVVNLSETGDLREAAANLFAALRTLDRSGCNSIAVLPIPGEGLGEAINDRLLRAAAPRP